MTKIDRSIESILSRSSFDLFFCRSVIPLDDSS